VALRWRIRHKLMLGLFLVVGLMALLLGGTLLGLWSYYVTTTIIRTKLAELTVAEEIKAAVATLVSPQNLADLRRYPAVKGKIKDVHNKLEEYEHLLQDNPIPPGDPAIQLHTQGMVEALTKNLEEFEAAILREAVPTVNGQDRDMEDSKEVHQLTKNARELRDHIYDQLIENLRESRRHYQITLWIVVPASSVGLLLMAGLMRSFYAWVFYPIRDLEAGVKRVAHGNFDQRIEVHSGDEMEDLGAAFNDMMKRLHDLYTDLARQVNERSRQLVRSERLASVGFLAAGVAHEINNPLASIAFCSEALEGRLGELLRQTQAPARSGDEREVFTKYLKMIQEEAFRCKSITERLLAFSRTGERRREMTDLGQLVQSVLDITQHLQNCRGKQIAFEMVPERGGNGRLQAPVNGEEIKSVVLNLVVNALDSMEDGGRLTIKLAQKDGMAEMYFTDTGCGMNQEVLENIFEPFFTRSRTGKGTGLGLTISHRIINQHGGEIEATSPGPNQGSTFVVRLPLQYEETPTPTADGAPAPVPAAGRPVKGKAA
jgi:two-component system, NtrC family, sensor kinase